MRTKAAHEHKAEDTPIAHAGQESAAESPAEPERDEEEGLREMVEEGKVMAPSKSRWWERRSQARRCSGRPRWWARPRPRWAWSQRTASTACSAEERDRAPG
jgi:hypothetical protein